MESSDGNTLKDTESIFTDTGDSPTKSPYKLSLLNKADSYSEEHYLPSSPKQVSFTGKIILRLTNDCTYTYSVVMQFLCTETCSEQQTDVEQRVASLRQKLSQRKHTARQLKIELKRKQREDLKSRELLLRQQLEVSNIYRILTIYLSFIVVRTVHINTLILYSLPLMFQKCVYLN